MANNTIFNSDQLSVKYVSTPGLTGEGTSGILTFNSDNGSVGNVDTALLIDSVSINFSRTISKRYFVNIPGCAYIVGMGNGTMQVSGLLGKADDFKELFGANLSDPCKTVRTATIKTKPLQACDGNSVNSDKITLTGVIPNSIRIDTRIEQDGVLYYMASGSFEFTGMAFE